MNSTRCLFSQRWLCWIPLSMSLLCVFGASVDGALKVQKTWRTKNYKSLKPANLPNEYQYYRAVLLKADDRAIEAMTKGAKDYQGVRSIIEGQDPANGPIVKLAVFSEGKHVVDYMAARDLRKKPVHTIFLSGINSTQASAAAANPAIVTATRLRTRGFRGNIVFVSQQKFDLPSFETLNTLVKSSTKQDFIPLSEAMYNNFKNIPYISKDNAFVDLQYYQNNLPGGTSLPPYIKKPHTTAPPSPSLSPDSQIPDPLRRGVPPAAKRQRTQTPPPYKYGGAYDAFWDT